MEPAPPNSPRPPLEVRGVRASSVIVQRVPPRDADVFMTWQRGITAAAAQFPGYQTTEIYPPPPGQQEWVVVVHFDDARALQGWLDSPARAEWLKRLRRDMGEFHLKTLPAGFGAWFTGQADGSDGMLPPSWKVALSVLLALYPTVVLLAIALGPILNPLGLALSVLASNVLSVSLLQWAVTPVLRPMLAPWLRANGEGRRAYSMGGLVVILLLLGGMALLFRVVTG
jgi:uncharacterized protein